MSAYSLKLRTLIPKSANGIEIHESKSGIKGKPRKHIELRRWGEVFKPFRYQKEIIDGIGNIVEKRNLVGLVSLPTGSGKTLTASRFVLNAINLARSQRKNPLCQHG